MATTLCIVTDPERAPLEDHTIKEVSAFLDTPPRWLAEQEACEFSGSFSRDAAISLANTLRGQGIGDVAVLPSEGRRKRLLIADMDSTIITIECIDELADFLGIKEEIASITSRAMNGEVDFAAALRARVALLRGLKASVIDEICRERIQLTAGARCLVQTMRANRAVTALVSGGFTQFTGHVAELAGFEHHFGNRLEIRNGCLTGGIEEPLRDGPAKLETLKQLSLSNGLQTADAVAVGDGSNDLEMIKAAGIGCAYRGHQILRNDADVGINSTSLMTVLFAQGIERREFVDAN